MGPARTMCQTETKKQASAHIWITKNSVRDAGAATQVYTADLIMPQVV